MEAGSPAHLFMHAMSQEAIRITMEINNQMYFDDPDAATRKTAEWLRRCRWVDAEH